MFLMPNKNKLTTAFVLFSFLFSFLAIHVADEISAAETPAVEAPEGLVAKVNHTEISRQELDREMNMVSFKMTRQGRPVTVEQLKRYENDIRETLISRTLLLQQAEAMEIGVKESLEAKATEEFKAGFKDEKAYREQLVEMGFTEEELQKQIHDGLAIKSLLDKEVLTGAMVTDEQVRAYYDKNPDRFKNPEQVKASHILIQVEQNATPAKKEDALTTIKGLKERIDKGEEFAVLAQDYSDCPSKAKGGDLGFFTREQMVPPFSKAAFELSPGEISDVVETRFGYHLILVTDRKPAQTLAFNDVKEEISNRLRREEERKRIDAYLGKLTNQAEIQRYPL